MNFAFFIIFYIFTNIKAIVVVLETFSQYLSLRIKQAHHIFLILSDEGCFLVFSHPCFIFSALANTFDRFKQLDLREVGYCAGFEASVNLALCSASLLQLELIVLTNYLLFFSLHCLLDLLLFLIVFYFSQALLEVFTKEVHGPGVRIGQVSILGEIFLHSHHDVKVRLLAKF